MWVGGWVDAGLGVSMKKVLFTPAAVSFVDNKAVVCAVEKVCGCVCGSFCARVYVESYR